MVVDHADEGGAGVEECGDDVEVRHFVDEDGVRLEGVEGVADGGCGVGGRDGEAVGEDGAPCVFVFAGARAVEDGDGEASFG